MQHKNEDLAKEVGRKVRHHRQIRLIGQKQLADMAGLNPSHLNHIEAGRRLPDLEVIRRVTRALDVSLVEIVPL